MKLHIQSCNRSKIFRPVRSGRFQIPDRSGPAGDRPVEKTLQTGKNRQKLTSLLGYSLPVKKKDPNKYPCFCVLIRFYKSYFSRTTYFVPGVVLREKYCILRRHAIQFLTRTWGVLRVFFLICKPVKTGEDRPVQTFQPVRSGFAGPVPTLTYLPN